MVCKSATASQPGNHTNPPPGGSRQPGHPVAPPPRRRGARRYPDTRRLVNEVLTLRLAPEGGLSGFKDFGPWGRSQGRGRCAPGPQSGEVGVARGAGIVGEVGHGFSVARFLGLAGKHKQEVNAMRKFRGVLGGENKTWTNRVSGLLGMLPP